MTCQEYWDTMPELGDSADADAAAHKRECASCASALRNQDALAAGLRGVAAEWSGLKAPGRVEARLLAAFRGHAGMAPPSVRRWWSPVLAWVAAAIVVTAAFLLFVVRNRQPRTPPPSTGVEAAVTDWPTLSSEGVAADSAGFIPLPNAGQLPQDEDLNVVRVEVPRSAMIALGYSVAADRASKRVRADVLMGSDGLARAVRFLDE